MKTNCQFLIDLGFEHAGTWLHSASGIECKLIQHSNESNILYAFVSKEEVLYIGKSVKALSRRMYGYQRPGPTQNTNIANKTNIIRTITSGHEIDILVFINRSSLEYHGVPVNLAAGLEDPLIKLLCPRWNLIGVDGKKMSCTSK